MNIKIVKAVGEGTTLLSSFDSALQNAGVSNYNLIRLSSVIPPNSKIIRTTKFVTPPDEFGHKLYNVMAEMRSNQAGRYLAAGIGWYQLEDGRGLFVEHELIGDTKIAVQSELLMLIRNSLRDLCRFRKIDFNENKVNHCLSVARVKNKPACALVIAVYQSQGWEN